MAELLEREPALRTLRGLLDDAQARGHVALIAGEAGIGKTSVLRALAAGHAQHGPVWWGACDALQTPHPLAPLLDIARDQPARFAGQLNGPRPALFEAVLDELRLAAAPVLMIVEDAHWADDATLDLLKFLGRRIERVHALLAVSFRDDEVTSTHPLRRVLGELPVSARTRVDLPPLSPQAVEALAHAAERPAAGVHALTRGNPFFVTEVLRDTGHAVPVTVQDVVLARATRLPARAQRMLQLASVVPGHIERWLVDELLAPPLADVEACLGSGLLVAEAADLRFRHELGRVAVEASLSAPLAQSLHASVLAALTAPGRSSAAARRVHHAVRAGDTAAISRYAPLAAREAAERGAHREAAAHWRIALQYGKPADRAERRQWLEQSAVEVSVLGLNQEALAQRRALEQLALERGDIADAAMQVSRQAMQHIGLMRHDLADELNHRALAMLEPLPAGPAHATVWQMEAYLRMLNRDCEDSVAWALRAAELAAALGDDIIAMAALSALGTARMFIDYERGIAEMQRALQQQLAAGRLQPASVTLGNLGSGSGELMQLGNAERWLRESLALAVANEFDNQAWYCRSWVSLTGMLRGRWDEAASLASEVVNHEGVADMSRLMALLALGRLRVRRGDPGALEALDAGLALTGSQNTLQRIAPLRAARAEAAIARDDAQTAATEVAAALPLAIAHRHPWFIGELAYWGWRAGIVDRPPQHCAEPYALEMTGHWREAATAWQALDCPYEQARALVEGDEAAQRQALAIFESLGARPAADALRRRLREAGVRGVTRGARASTRSHPCGLTDAEMKVLTLLAQDLRNADIATRLHRSVRTVDHHVAAVLAKLGAQTRQEAVRRAQREGWLHQAS